MDLSWISGVATLVFVTTCFIILSLRHKNRLEFWNRKTATIRLSKPINQLSTWDLFTLFVGMLEKYALHLVGFGTTARRHSNGFLLPRLELHGRLELTLEDVGKFKMAVPDDSDSSGPMLLTAFVAPAIPCLLSHHACSVKPLGVLNTRNTIVSYSSTTSDIERLLSTELSFRATVGGDGFLGTRHRRGMLFTVLIDIFAEDSAGASTKIMSQHLEYLQLLASSEEPRYVKPAIEDNKPNRKDYDSACTNESSSLVASLHLKQQDILHWAACNRDYNPIHLSTATAKAFGQRSIVAHGSYVVARALAGIKLPSDGVWNLEMRFLRPVSLPLRGQIRRCQTDRDDGTTAIGVLDDRRNCLTWIVCTRKTLL